jgi:hypothetical protein
MPASGCGIKREGQIEKNKLGIPASLVNASPKRRHMNALDESTRHGHCNQIGGFLGHCVYVATTGPPKQKVSKI